MNRETRLLSRSVWHDGTLGTDTDEVVVESPVALVYNGVSHVVTMATPSHLEELALGFSLSEGILEEPAQLLDCTVQWREQGIELLLNISARAFVALKRRRRNLTGRTGCGLCGLESLQQALPVPVPVQRDCRVSHVALQRAVAHLGSAQKLKQRTGGVHGAAWCAADGSIELLREDVGRHNALDKLLGAMHRCEHSPGGFALVTSRASYEMVAKVAACDISVLAAVSAPTALAVEYAQQCGVTLAGFVQPGRQVIYTHPQRVVEAP